jgi:hypothetical protein
MSSLAIRLLAEPLRSLAFGSISGVYAGIGTSFDDPCRIMYMVNTTDVLLTFSLDGVNDHFVIASGSYLIIDISSNKTLTGGQLTISQGQRIYVKGSPSLGAVYLTNFYGANG